MNIIVTDVEVFKFDWLVVFKDVRSGEYTVIHNDNHALKQFMTESDAIFAFFNGKHYDQFIIKAICTGADNSIVKEVNDFIIRGEQGWEHWWIQSHPFYFPLFDIRDDMQQGLSLKAIEGHLGLDIEESSVSFDIDRPLTESEIEETVGYCKYDVDVAEQLVKLRKPYLNGKLSLGRMKGIPDAKALYATNAKITAMFLEAKRQERYDERNYQYPDNLRKEVIPQEVIEFFDKMRDISVPDDVLFKSKLDIEIAGGLVATYGFGGIHAGLKNYAEVSEE